MEFAVRTLIEPRALSACRIAELPDHGPTCSAITLRLPEQPRDTVLILNALMKIIINQLVNY